MKTKIDNEIKGILVELEKTNDKISNLDIFIEKSISISQNISNYWSSGDYRTRIKIQDLVFPDGIVLNTKKRQYLTKNKNLVFVCIEEIAWETRGQKKDSSVKNTEESDEVAISIKKSNQNKQRFVDDANRLLKFYDYLIDNELIAEVV